MFFGASAGFEACETGSLAVCSAAVAGFAVCKTDALTAVPQSVQNFFPGFNSLPQLLQKAIHHSL
jgi:hypothetical protein